MPIGGGGSGGAVGGAGFTVLTSDTISHPEQSGGSFETHTFTHNQGVEPVSVQVHAFSNSHWGPLGPSNGTTGWEYAFGSSGLNATAVNVYRIAAGAYDIRIVCIFEDA